MSLRYPSDAFSGDADYVSFRHMKYTSRGSGGGGGGGGYITICMPEQMPPVNNKNNWGELSVFAPGPLGALQRDIAEEVINLTDINLKEGMSREAQNRGIDRIRGKFDAVVDNAGPLARQAALTNAAGAIKRSPSQVLSVTQGQIYNPNIELVYNGPGLRHFGFTFNLVPKSAGDASIISSIIREFKTWSAPKVISGGMYEIPHVWQISYMSGGGQNGFQNKFKPAALTDIIVTDNQGFGFYSAHEGGAPIQTTLQLGFQEVDVITRKDHSGMRGM
jgi:hypothetical protein